MSNRGFKKLALCLEDSMKRLGFEEHSRTSFRCNGFLVRFLFERDVRERVRVIRVAISHRRLGTGMTLLEVCENGDTAFMAQWADSRALAFASQSAEIPKEYVTFKDMERLLSAIANPEEMPLLVGERWAKKVVRDWGL